MTSRLLRIRGRSEASRKARLESARAWLSARGWRLVDYSDSARQALFEPASDEPAGGGPPRWHAPPGGWSGLIEEWTAPRRLLPLGLAALVLAALIGVNAQRQRFDAGRAASEGAERWWVVTADRVNVREGPSSEASVVGMLHKGQRVLVVKRDGQWAEVLEPERGYLSVEFLEPPKER